MIIQLLWLPNIIYDDLCRNTSSEWLELLWVSKKKAWTHSVNIILKSQALHSSYKQQ